MVGSEQFRYAPGLSEASFGLMWGVAVKYLAYLAKAGVLI